MNLIWSLTLTQEWNMSECTPWTYANSSRLLTEAAASTKQDDRWEYVPHFYVVIFVHLFWACDFKF